MSTVTLDDGGQVQYTDPTGQQLTITAEQTDDGGWDLSIAFSGVSVCEVIHLTDRLSKPGEVIGINAAPYDWGKG